MYGLGRLGSVMGSRDSWVFGSSNDYGARKLLTKEQHAGGKAAAEERTGSHRWPTGRGSA